MKKNILSRLRPWQSEFSHRYACWANNHNGWSKMKKTNRRLAKRRLNRIYKEIGNNAVGESDCP